MISAYLHFTGTLLERHRVNAGITVIVKKDATDFYLLDAEYHP